jgi:outer membrane protein OmpA-like peptidoglycan-associated protein
MRRSSFSLIAAGAGSFGLWLGSTSALASPATVLPALSADGGAAKEATGSLLIQVQDVPPEGGPAIDQGDPPDERKKKKRKDRDRGDGDGGGGGGGGAERQLLQAPDQGGGAPQGAPPPRREMPQRSLEERGPDGDRDRAERKREKARDRAEEERERQKRMIEQLQQGQQQQDRAQEIPRSQQRDPAQIQESLEGAAEKQKRRKERAAEEERQRQEKKVQELQPQDGERQISPEEVQRLKGIADEKRKRKDRAQGEDRERQERKLQELQQGQQQQPDRGQETQRLPEQTQDPAAINRSLQDEAEKQKRRNEEKAEEKQDRREGRGERREDALEELRDQRRDKREEKADDRQDRRERKDEALDELRDQRRDRKEAIQDRREDRRERRDARRFDELKGLRKERKEGNRVFIEEPDKRIIVKDRGRTIIKHDERERFRRGARDVREHRRPDGGRLTIFVGPGGAQIVTEYDRYDRMLRRLRRHGGREYVLIDNRQFYGAPPGPGGYYVDLPPPRIGIPRDDYIVDYEGASEEDLYEALTAPPVEPLERGYALEEIQQSHGLRERMRSVDLDTINFEFGSWEVMEEYYGALERLAEVINRIVQQDPQEVYLIEGHTDAVGSDDDNLSLSDRRAESVAVILSENFGVPAENLVTQGYGEQFLKVQTEEPNRENRRVSVRRITPLMTSEVQGQAPQQE